MRLGRERPRKGHLPGRRPQRLRPRFNEAGARTPQKGSGACRRFAVGDASMRLGRERPRKDGRPVVVTEDHVASMRLGRERPRKVSRVGDDAHNIIHGFNEAGARTPQKARFREMLHKKPSRLQ